MLGRAVDRFVRLEFRIVDGKAHKVAGEIDEKLYLPEFRRRDVSLRLMTRRLISALNTARETIPAKMSILFHHYDLQPHMKIEFHFEACGSLPM